MLNPETLQKYKTTIEKREKIITDLKEKKDQLVKKFDEEHKEELEKLGALNDVHSELKTLVEFQALAEYEKTKQKKLLGGIGIRIYTTLEYNQIAALNWALNHKICLQLDKKNFEKLAKTQPLEFVKKGEREVVTFPSKLDLPVDE